MESEWNINGRSIPAFMVDRIEYPLTGVISLYNSRILYDILRNSRPTEVHYTVDPISKIRIHYEDADTCVYHISLAALYNFVVSLDLTDDCDFCGKINWRKSGF